MLEHNKKLLVQFFLIVQLIYLTIFIFEISKRQHKPVSPNVTKQIIDSDSSSPVKSLSNIPKFLPLKNQQSIAIIVPYRNREEQIQPFVEYMIEFLRFFTVSNCLLN